MDYLKAPLDFTRPELPELRDVFVAAYDREARARALARQAGIVPGTFPEHDTMRTTWFYLIDTMARQGRLVRMIEVAAQDPEAADFKQRFEEFLAGNPAISTLPRSTDDSWYQGADRDPAKAPQIHLQRLIYNRNRLMDIELAAKVVEAAKSVAYLALVYENGERGHGTGFLIGPDLILTNHHNVTDEKLGNVKEVTADFNYVEGRQGTPLTVRTDSIKANQAHDWAVIQLANAVDLRPIPLGTSYTVAMDDTVVIIQHPVGSSKKFALDTLSIQHVGDDVIQYLADTQAGSSGSPVFNTQMQPIALHHAEAVVNIEVAGRTECAWRNEGINIKRVIEDLDKEGIKLERN